MKSVPKSHHHRDRPAVADEPLETYELRRQNEHLRQEVCTLKRRVAELSFRLDQAQSTLRSIKQSRTWRINRWYMKRVHSRRTGRMIERLVDSLGARSGKRRERAEVAEGKPGGREKAEFEALISVANERPSKGTFLVTAAFPFDDSMNQRVINLSKEMVEAGYRVIFGVWRWSRDDFLDDITGEVSPGIFQVPLDVVSEHHSLLSRLKGKESYFLIEFVHESFLALMTSLKRSGFVLIYDIIDDWEEFSKAGKAPWFDHRVEQALVTTADVVTAVSPALAAKFSSDRADIHIVANGFSKRLLGINYENICGRNATVAKAAIDIGYFGHLEPAWFDWDAVFDLARNNNDFRIHIIGYGEDDGARSRANRFGNIALYGKVHPSRLYRYVKDWDVGIIPFRRSRLSLAVDPIKLYEYLYFGLPVVMRNISVASCLESLPFLRSVKDGETIAEAVRELVKNKRKGGLSYDRIKEVVTQCTWQRRFDEMLAIVQTAC